MNEPRPIHRGDELLLEIAEAAFEGKAVARHEGFVVFVEGAVPGDRALVRIGTVKRSFAEGRVIRLEAASPLRTSPRCRYVGVCGGCKWQHVSYEAQLRFKEQQVRDALQRIGGFADANVESIIGATDIFFYRAKMEYSFAPRQWLHEGAEVSDSAAFVGLHVPGRYDKVLDIAECHLQSEISNRILRATRAFARERNIPVYDPDRHDGYFRFLVIRESKRTGERMVNLVTLTDDPERMQTYAAFLRAEVPEITTIVNTVNSGKAQVAFGDTERVYWGDGIIREQLGRYRFAVSAGSFFQTNVAQAERLYEVAKSLGSFRPDDVVWDLYSGTGSIAIFISDAVRTVVGIESVASAIRDAERNAAANGVKNCTFVLGDLKDRLTKDSGWMKDHEHPTAMVIDPPRSGMHPRVVQEVIGLAPGRIVYVSCNPATQARDLKDLCASAYRLVKCQPVDMFPHTYHIENVALLERV